MNNKKILISLIENWPVKVLSVALALILFVFHRLNTLTTRAISVPLTIETTTELIAASDYPAQVRVTVRGEDSDIHSIVDSDIDAYVDLSRYESIGFYSAPVQVRKKGSALNIEPLEILVSPLKIAVQLDERISKTIPLVAFIQGRAANGFDFVTHSLSPQTVTLTGPRGYLESVTEIKTEPIDINGRSENFSMEVNIANPNPLFIIRGGGMAQVFCQIRPSVSVRSVDGIPFTLVDLAPDFETDIGGRTGSIRIEGTQARLDGFRLTSDLLVVDCSEISEPGTYTLPVIVNIPLGYTLLRYEPEELGLTIILKDSENEEEDAL